VDSPRRKFSRQRVKPHDFHSSGAARAIHEVMDARHLRQQFCLKTISVSGQPRRRGPLSTQAAETILSTPPPTILVKSGLPLIVIAGKEYGSVSSLTGQQGPLLLGVRAALAESF